MRVGREREIAVDFHIFCSDLLCSLISFVGAACDICARGYSVSIKGERGREGERIKRRSIREVCVCERHRGRCEPRRWTACNKTESDFESLVCRLFFGINVFFDSHFKDSL